MQKKRQWLLIVVTLFAAFVLAWQIYSLVHERLLIAPSVRAPAVVKNQLPVRAAIKQPSPPPPRELPVMHVKAALDDSSVMSPQARAYWQLSKQYEWLKMQKALVQEQADIASAKQRIAQANKMMLHLQSGAQQIGDKTPAPVGPSGYILSYTGRQAGLWQATLSQGDVYWDVVVGSHLPDGSRVSSIGAFQVVIVRKHHKDAIVFAGVAPRMGIQKVFQKLN